MPDPLYLSFPNLGVALSSLLALLKLGLRELSSASLKVDLNPYLSSCALAGRAAKPVHVSINVNKVMLFHMGRIFCFSAI